MLDILLDSGGDLKVSETGDISLTESVRQAIRIRLLWFLGEWRLGPLLGLDYWGTILVKNPRLLESLASALYARRGETLPEERAADSWAVRGYAVTEEQLRRRFVR